VNFLPGNRIELLETGADYFPALHGAIATAECTIHIETYIFATDATGRTVAEALATAARRGVAVRVLVDGFGARDFLRDLGHVVTAAGGEVAVYRPEVARLRLRRNRLRRLHRKIAVIDGQVALVGGINIIDDLNNGDTPNLGPRFDYAVRIEGPLLEPVCASVQHLWRLVGWARLRRRPPEPAPSACARIAPAGTTTAAFVTRDNLHHRRDIEEAYLEAIAAAHDDILIASAYFLPGRRLRHALLDAAARGCRVTVLLQGQVEYALLHYATQAFYGLLLDNGVRIHEYRAGFLHAKVAVVDDTWATVGSSNIDPFSLLLAREANIVVKDAAFATRLRASLARAMARDAIEITHADYHRSSWLARAMRWTAYGLVRLMLGITRYGGADYRE
jgi:cardiolipin synthase